MEDSREISMMNETSIAISSDRCLGGCGKPTNNALGRCRACRTKPCRRCKGSFVPSIRTKIDLCGKCTDRVRALQ
jgi:hypothetical protein